MLSLLLLLFLLLCDFADAFEKVTIANGVSNKKMYKIWHINYNCASGRQVIEAKYKIFKSFTDAAFYQEY